jgi:hypothetical protein
MNIANKIIETDLEIYQKPVSNIQNLKPIIVKKNFLSDKNKEKKSLTPSELEYNRGLYKKRTLQIKQERQNILDKYKHLPQFYKFKCNVSNGFTMYYISDIEVVDILDMFDKKLKLQQADLS